MICSTKSLFYFRCEFGQGVFLMMKMNKIHKLQALRRKSKLQDRFPITFVWFSKYVLARMTKENQKENFYFLFNRFRPRRELRDREFCFVYILNYYAKKAYKSDITFSKKVNTHFPSNLAIMALNHFYHE